MKYDIEKQMFIATNDGELSEMLYNHPSIVIWDPSLPYKVHNYCFIELKEGLAHVELLPPTGHGIREPFPYVYMMANSVKDRMTGMVFSWYSEIGPTGPLGMVTIQNNQSTECFHFDEFIPKPGTEEAGELFDEIIRSQYRIAKRGIPKERLICNIICN